MLTLARLREAALAQFLQQLVELLAQRLLVLAQFAHLVAVALLALLALLAALLAALVLALAEGAVAQLLLLADHVAELVERLTDMSSPSPMSPPGRAICRFSSICWS